MENTDLLFMNKVNEILEKNLSTEKYRIDKLCVDIGTVSYTHLTLPTIA